MSFLDRLGVRPPVGESADLNRIIALPRRPRPDLQGVRGAAMVELMNSRLRRHRTDPCACRSMGRACILSMRPAQAWPLYELGIVGGLLGHIGVGHGKTALDFLAPLVVPGCKVAALFIPPGLREQFLREYLLWREHWHVPSVVMDDGRGYIVPCAPVMHVIPYSRLSRPESTDLLESLKPDFILADEVHRLRHLRTAGTGRFIRYFSKHRDTRFAGWSGTVTGKSLLDYTHLAALGLREFSPVPLDPDVAAEWDLCLGAHDWPAPPGALRKLGPPPTREAFHNRLVETRGVVATTEGASDSSLNFYERETKTPPEVKKLLREVRTAWVRPDGEELVEALEVRVVARQLASGFYYRWIFPRKEPEAQIVEWFAARKAWNQELREKLKNGREHLDSPALAVNAVERAYAGYEGDLPVWRAATWPRWKAVRDTVYHETEAVWVSDWLAQDAALWALKHRGVVWCDTDAFGRRVAELAGLPYHAGGPGAEALILAEKGDRSVVASWHAHGTGRDGLQRLFKEQYIPEPPSSNSAFEQLLGRLCRVGQDADEVDTWVPRHEPELVEALDSAIMQAEYVFETTGTQQHLLQATFSFSVGR